MAFEVILVTGGSGLVGKAIEHIVNHEGLKKDNEKWIFLSSKDLDLTNFNATEAFFQTHRPTQIIHLAAKVGGLFANMGSNVEFFDFNMHINMNVLQCSHKYNVKKVVSCLSTCVFPTAASIPMDESMLHNGPPNEFHFGYSYAKRMVDVMNRAYKQQYGRQFTSAIPCNIFGPNDNFEISQCHVLPSLIHKTYLAKRDGTPLVVLGSGRGLRQFIYSLDLARLFVWSLRNYGEIDPIIFSVGEEDEISIKDAVEVIVKTMDFHGPIQYDTTKTDGHVKKTASNKKLMKLVPDFKFTPFEQAMKETIDWFVANYDTIRK